MKRELLLAEFRRTPWALEGGYLATVAGMLSRWQRGEHADAADLAEFRAERQAAATRQRTLARTAGGSIALIPVYGVISQRAGMVQEYSGGTSCQAVAAALREALDDESIGQILLDLDSQGGSVFGIQELATTIMQARQQKPIIGVANSVAASAAYWLAACCTELYCTPGGEVGSIGVWMAHEDISKAMDAAGVKTTLISSGKYKTEGNSLGPLSAEALGFLQSRTDEYFKAFTTAVARGRGVPVDAVRNGMGQGRMLLADAALREKMIDGIASIEQVIAGMQRNIRTGGAGRQRALAVPAAGAGAIQRSAKHRENELQILEAECGIRRDRSAQWNRNDQLLRSLE